MLHKDLVVRPKVKKQGLLEKSRRLAFSSKALGCYGDGGAIFTNDEELAHKMKSIRIHGSGSDKYENVRIGINGRLDTIQAAILLEKLFIFDEELKLRNMVADYYRNNIVSNFKNHLSKRLFIHGHNTHYWLNQNLKGMK